MEKGREKGEMMKPATSALFILVDEHPFEIGRS
jgi:hypothetical protein